MNYASENADRAANLGLSDVVRAGVSSIPALRDRRSRRCPRPHTEICDGGYVLRFVHSAEELDRVLRLRFEVFNLELGEGLESSYASARDRDEFDSTCHHLMVLSRHEGQVVGTYRVQTSDMALTSGGFYSANEFDLSKLPPGVLEHSVELGRACIARNHRNTRVLLLLWRGLASYVAYHRKRYLFGCCSLTSQNPWEGRALYDSLRQNDQLHGEFSVWPLAGLECDPGDGTPMTGPIPSMPRLFGTYLRLGAKVCGPPALDRKFKTIDFFVVLDVDRMSRHLHDLIFGR